MNRRPSVLDVQVKFRAMWKCRACNNVGAGDMVTAEFDYIPDHDALRRHQRAWHMPVGWASYGTAGVECPNHSKE